MRPARIAAAAALALSGLAGAGAQPASAAEGTFENLGAIAIPAGGATSGAAGPYPSTIEVAGLVGLITDVEVIIPFFSHTFPGDVDILLQGPGGQTVVLLSDAGGGTDAVNVELRFVDGGAQAPNPLVAGTYGPTNAAAGDAFPAPAPAAPHGDSLATFDNTDPNGTWRLFVVDDAAADTGSMSAGWRLRITTRDPACLGVAEDGFEDVGPANVHEANIDCIVAYGIATGTSPTTFAPAANVSRAQMASFVARSIEAAGVVLNANPPDAFTDDQGSIHEPRINQLAAAGVIGGNGEVGAAYFPSDDMRRDHMASFLFEAFEAISGAPLPAGPNAFTDDDGTPHEAAINALAAADVLSGTGGGLYDPNGSVSRGQMGSFLARFLELLNRNDLLP